MRRLFKVVFRNGSVVDERTVTAKSLTKAAKKAAKMTRENGGTFLGWSVYSITAM